MTKSDLILRLAEKYPHLLQRDIERIVISQHYSYEIDEFSHPGPRSFDEQWRAARAAVPMGRDGG